MMNTLRFGGGTAFSLDGITFYSTFHQLCHCHIKEEIKVGELINIPLSASIKSYLIDKERFIDNYDFFYEHAYAQIDENTLKIEEYTTQKILCEILMINRNDDIFIFRTLERISCSPILVDKTSSGEFSVSGFPHPVAWYHSDNALYTEVVISLFKSELSLIRRSISKESTQEHLIETFRYVNQMGTAEFIMSRFSHIENMTLNSSFLDELNLQLLTDFLITLGYLNDCQLYEEKSEKILCELRDWLNKVKLTISSDIYKKEWLIAENLLKSYDISSLVSFLSTQKKQLALSQIEFSYKQSIDLIKRGITLPPHNALVKINCQYEHSYTNTISFKGINASGLSGGAVLNQHGKAIGCIRESNNDALGQRYDSDLSALIKFTKI